jgi:hypothetical protein
MSCKFNIKTCSQCPKYNGCLLQLIYANTLSLAELIVNTLKPNNSTETIHTAVSSSNSLNTSSEIQELKESTNMLLQSSFSNDKILNGLLEDVSNIKSSLSVINLKVDDITSDKDGV